MSDNKTNDTPTTQPAIHDHLRWNYPHAIALAKAGNAELSKLLEVITNSALELNDIEEDLKLASQATPLNPFDQRKIHLRPIGIIIGHTANSGGAYSKTLQSSEYDFWTEYAPVIEKYLLENHGIKSVIRNRNNGTANAYKQIDEAEPLLTCELHFNGAFNTSVDGFETLALRGSSNGRAAASAFNNRYESVSDVEMRRPDTNGVKLIYKSEDPNTSRGMYSLTRSIYPSIITEPFYGSNHDDCHYFNIEHFCEALAAAYKSLL